MKEWVKRLCWLAAGLAVILGGSVTRGIPQTEAAPAVTVRYAPATVKIRQDIAYPDLSEEGIKVQMAKNEQESAQVILSAVSETSYDLIPAELRSGDNVLSADSVEIFHQKYFYLPSDGRNLYETGYYPDALVPLAAAKSCKENVIAPGKNQGVWVRFRTDKDTEAGIYTGHFTLKLGEETVRIPVSVEVWNFDVPDAVHTKSCFLLYPDALMIAEGDCTYENLKKYYDFFLDNRISLMHLPVWSDDTEGFLENLQTYWEDARFSAYALPYEIKQYQDNGTDFSDGLVYNAPDLEKLSALLKKIVALSVEQGTDYLSKAYFYNIGIDEYNGDSVRKMCADRWAFYFPKMIEETMQEIDGMFGTEYLDSVPGLRASLLGIDNLQVLDYSAAQDTFNSVCSLASQFSDQSVRKDAAETYDNVWVYTCSNPTPPYPTYHLGDVNLLSARLLSWMQYDYQFEGNLYYQVNWWTSTNSTDDTVAKDSAYGYHDYFTETGWDFIYGDGTLCYPGVKYGLDEPLTTVRLESIRDGLEEYEYFYRLEERYAEVSAATGMELDARTMLRSVFDSVYAGTICYADSDNFSTARETVARALELADGNAKFIVKSVTETETVFRVEILADATFRPTEEEFLTSETQTGGYGLYVFEIPKVETEDVWFSVKLSDGNETVSYRQLLSKAFHQLESFDNEASLGFIRTDGDEIEARLGTLEGVPQVNILMREENTSGFLLLSDLWEEQTGKMSSMTFYVYNDSGTDIEIAVDRRVGGGSTYYETILGSVLLKDGSWTRIQIDDLRGIESTKALRIRFPQELLPDTEYYSLYLGRFGYSV